MAACTSSVPHEHGKAIAAFEFVKRKAVTALLTLLHISGHILGRSACGESRDGYVCILQSRI